MPALLVYGAVQHFHLAKAVMRVSHRLGSSFVDPSSFWKEASPKTVCTCAIVENCSRTDNVSASASWASMLRAADMTPGRECRNAQQGYHMGLLTSVLALYGVASAVG